MLSQDLLVILEKISNQIVYLNESSKKNLSDILQNLNAERNYKILSRLESSVDSITSKFDEYTSTQSYYNEVTNSLSERLNSLFEHYESVTNKIFEYKTRKQEDNIYSQNEVDFSEATQSTNILKDINTNRTSPLTIKTKSKIINENIKVMKQKYNKNSDIENTKDSFKYNRHSDKENTKDSFKYNRHSDKENTKESIYVEKDNYSGRKKNNKDKSPSGYYKTRKIYVDKLNQSLDLINQKFDRTNSSSVSNLINPFEINIVVLNYSLSYDLKNLMKLNKNNKGINLGSSNINFSDNTSYYPIKSELELSLTKSDNQINNQIIEIVSRSDIYSKNKRNDYDGIRIKFLQFKYSQSEMIKQKTIVHKYASESNLNIVIESDVGNYDVYKDYLNYYNIEYINFNTEIYGDNDNSSYNLSMLDKKGLYEVIFRNAYNL